MSEYEDRYHSTLLIWDKLAGVYEANFMDLDLYNSTYNALCTGLPPEAEVLELACGPGNITRYLLTQRPDLRILATDVSPSMVNLAQKNNPGARCMVLDARNTADLRRSFNAVVAGFCLPYIAQAHLQGFFKGIRASLSLGGLLYLSFVEGDPAASGYKTGSTGDAMWFNYHSFPEVVSEAASHHLILRHKWTPQFKRSGGDEETHTVLIFSVNG